MLGWPSPDGSSRKLPARRRSHRTLLISAGPSPCRQSGGPLSRGTHGPGLVLRGQNPHDYRHARTQNVTGNCNFELTLSVQPWLALERRCLRVASKKMEGRGVRAGEGRSPFWSGYDGLLRNGDSHSPCLQGKESGRSRNVVLGGLSRLPRPLPTRSGTDHQDQRACKQKNRSKGGIFDGSLGHQGPS